MLSIADSIASYCDYKIDYVSAEKVIGLSDKDSIKNILTAIFNRNINEIFKAIKDAVGMGKNIQVLSKEMSDFIKNLIMIKSGVTDYEILDIVPGEFKQYADIAELFDMNYLKNAFSKFAQIELELKYSLNPENLFESSCLELLNFSENKNINSDYSNKTQNIDKEQKLKDTNIDLKSINNKSSLEFDDKLKKSNDLKNETLIQNSNIDKIWGNVLLKVKENNLFALSNALTTVIKVEELNHKLIIHTNDLSSYEMIDNKERIDVLLKLVKLFDDSIEMIEIEYDKENASIQDIKDNLKDVFKSKIKFKE